MSSQNSKNAFLFNEIGAAYFERNMYDKAEAAVKRAISLNDQPSFQTNLSVIYEKESRLPDAISTAQRAVTEAPKYIRARAQLCELLILSKRDTEALACYDEFARITPLDELEQTYYAVGLMHLGDADKVISTLTPLVSGRQPTALMYNTLGYAFYLNKSYPQAATAFKHGVELDPDNPHIRYNLAIVLNAQNDRAGALSQYNLIKRSNPSLADQLYRGLNQDKIIYVNESKTSKKR
jgi:tetratricopeptide (TPR) repeat protein